MTCLFLYLVTFIIFFLGCYKVAAYIKKIFYFHEHVCKTRYHSRDCNPLVYQQVACFSAVNVIHASMVIITVTSVVPPLFSLAQILLIIFLPNMFFLPPRSSMMPQKSKNKRKHVFMLNKKFKCIG